MAACPNCGSETAAAARFCPGCGATLAAPVGAAPVATAAPGSGLSVNNWMVLCHLSALAGLVIPSLGHVLGPLVVWLVKKDEIPQVDVEGKESLNFQLSMSIYMMISAALIFVLIGLPMLLVVALADLILTVVAAVKTSQGVLYRYPFTIRFLK
jgi:uncharacterized Tic20 family protein